MESNVELHPALEQEIKILSEKIEARSKEVGVEKIEVEKVLRERTKEFGEKKEVAEASKILPEYSTKAPEDARLFVEQIVDQLWHDGNLSKAVNEAKRGGPLALDMFHDILSGKMTEILKARGIL